MRHKRRRHNPIDTKIAWAVGLTALVAGAVGVGVYFATKKEPALQAGPPGSGGTVKPPAGGSPSTGPVTAPQTVAVASGSSSNNSPTSVSNASQALVSFSQLANQGIHAPRKLSETGLAPDNQLSPDTGNY